MSAVLKNSPVEKTSREEDTLLRVADELARSVKFFHEINARANIISLNAAIEGARMRAKAPSFSIVAQQVHSQSQRNLDLSEKLATLVRKIQDVSLRATAARSYELAEDLIDKIDRNLFERNCDVQAWATFESIQTCATLLADISMEDLDSQFQERLAEVEAARAVLEKLVDTYVVYSDIFIINKNGLVINSAKRPHLQGKNCSKEEWFAAALKGQVHVSEMTHCPMVESFAVMYSAPIQDTSGNIVGVVSTRFNWDYGQEMIDHAGLDKNVRAYYIDKLTSVMAATGKLGIMKDSMEWLDGGRATAEGYCGFSIERDRNGSPIAVGFAKTRGYNSYAGKKWAAVVSARIQSHTSDNFFEYVDHRTESFPQGQKSEETLIESEKANLALRETMQEVEALVRQINLNNREAKFLAINASIQSGIAGEEGEGFAIIAGEIGRLAKMSLEFVHTVNGLANRLKASVNQTVNTRLSDAARDAIDKVDRNLFERFCDVQAWTTFQLFKDAIGDSSLRGKANELAARLHKIYEVYHEVLLLDAQGNIVSCAKERGLIGQNQSNRDWFREALSGKVFFSDVYHSKTTGGPTVTYAAPIWKENEVIGVLTTRFNCNFLNDILKCVIIDSQSEVYLTNKDGLVISTADGKETLSKSYKELEIFDSSQRRSSGLIAYRDPSKNSRYSIGFAQGSGYNTYTGKDWFVLITRPDETTTTDKDVIDLKKKKRA